MGYLAKIVFLVVLVISTAVVLVILCLALPISKLVEIFLVLLGWLIIAGLGILITKEISELMDLRHHHKVQHELRELELQRRKQQYVMQSIRHRRMTRGRGPYY